MRHLFMFILVSAVIFVDAYHSESQVKQELTNTGIDNQNQLIDNLNSNDPSTRSRAANEIILIYYHKGVLINEALPGLIRELEQIDWDNLTEGSGEYSAELIYILGEYKDKRAIHALLNCLGYAGGTLVIDAYMKMGPPIIEPLIDKLEDKRSFVRADAIFYIGKVPIKMVREGMILSEQDREHITEAFKRALKDQDYNVRSNAIDGILDNQDIFKYEEIKNIILILEVIAKEDSYVIITKEEHENYPVREKAVEVLEELKEKQIKP